MRACERRRKRVESARVFAAKYPERKTRFSLARDTTLSLITVLVHAYAYGRRYRESLVVF